METDRMTSESKPESTTDYVDFHRNGISGQPFYAVRFNWVDENNIERKMHATIAVEGDVLLSETCRVMDLDYTRMTWRGDNMAPRVMHKIQRHILNDGTDKIIPVDNVLQYDDDGNVELRWRD